MKKVQIFTTIAYIFPLMIGFRCFPIQANQMQNRKLKNPGPLPQARKWPSCCFIRLRSTVATASAKSSSTIGKLSPGGDFDLNPFVKSLDPLTWRQRFKASFGHDPLECPNCQTIMELVEIWEPERRYVWMKRWLETHRRRKMAAQALARFRA